jgi:hypothetical protein
MAAYSEELKELLLRTDHEFQELVSKHSELESRLREFSSKQHLSEPEQFEAATMKKTKLLLKDRMENILRRSSQEPPTDRTSQVSTSTH